MKKFLSVLLLVLSFVIAVMALYEFSGKTMGAITYMCGMIGGMSLGIIKLLSKNAALNSYKRELEKEAISSDESSAKVKVLESKIEVLEKALENALKGK